MQLLLKALLYPELADVVGTPIVTLVVAAFDGFFFGLVDAANVAHHMAAQLAIRITAEQPSLDVNAWEAKTLRCKTGDFFIGQTRANRQGLKVF